MALDAAVRSGIRSLRIHATYLQSRLLMAATCAMLEMSEEAAAHASAVLETRPDFSCQRFAQRFGYVLSDDRDQFVEGLRLSGLPN